MRNSLESTAKRLALSVLPHRLLWWLWHLRRRGMPRTEDGTATDLRIVPLQDGVRLEVYWSEVAMGPGPSASLYVLEEEVLRLDCFAGRNAHLHLNPVQLNLALPWNITPRLFFPPAGADEQIRRGAFELETNAVAALQMNQLAWIRQFPIDRARLAAAASQMETLMRELTTQHQPTAKLEPTAKQDGPAS